jgi:hypothetical protein
MPTLRAAAEPPEVAPPPPPVPPPLFELLPHAANATAATDMAAANFIT